MMKGLSSLDWRAWDGREDKEEDDEESERPVDTTQAEGNSAEQRETTSNTANHERVSIDSCGL